MEGLIHYSEKAPRSCDVERSNDRAPSSLFIGLIKSFSFDCKSRATRITAFPQMFGKSVDSSPNLI
jgi:hypothetical protein